MNISDKNFINTKNKKIRNCVIDMRYLIIIRQIKLLFIAQVHKKVDHSSKTEFVIGDYGTDLQLLLKSPDPVNSY